MKHTLIEDNELRQNANEFAERLATVEVTVERAAIARAFWLAVVRKDTKDAVYWLGELDGTIEMIDEEVER